MNSINQRLFLVNLIVLIVAIAALRMAFDLSDFTQLLKNTDTTSISDIQNRLFMAVGVVIAVIFLLQWYLSRTIARPIKNLIGRIDKIVTTGNYSPLPLIGHDEIALLSSRFNILQAHVTRRIDEMEQFADNICHEIRTPLTSIVSSTEIARKNLADTDAGAVKFLHLIEKEAKNLQELADKVLAYARQKGDNRVLHRRPADICNLINELVDRLQIKGRCNLEIPNTPIFCNIDSKLWAQAVGMILDNSVRYSPTATKINVDLKAEADSTCSLIIANESPHIPEVFLERIFERFFSLRIADNKKGTGIGLALARDIVEMHDGSIEAVNLAPAGVAFIIRLPLSPSQQRWY